MDNISIVIRNRNEGEYIGSAIQSCLDYFNKPEIIVVDNNSTYKMLNNTFLNYELTKRSAKELMEINRNKFTLKKMEELLNKMVDDHISGSLTSAKQVSLNLPKLKKVSDKNSTKPKLPKLKKV